MKSSKNLKEKNHSKKLSLIPKSILLKNIYKYREINTENGVVLNLLSMAFAEKDSKRDYEKNERIIEFCNKKIDIRLERK